jgi:hypothetical protein
MTIDLTGQEKDLLAELLDKELEDVRSELHHTQVFEYKEKLRCREELVRGLWIKLRA